MHDDVKTFFESADGRALPVHETIDADHGRIETRRTSMTDDIGWLVSRNPGWRDLRSIGMVQSCTEKNGVPKRQTRFYLCSRADDPAALAACVRGHWGIENSLHWVLDVTFNEDQCRVRKDHAPHILAVVKRCAINLINKNKGKNSVKSTRRRAGWGDKTMRDILLS